MEKERIFNLLNKFRQEKFMVNPEGMIDISEYDNLMDSIMNVVEPKED